jgi:lipopolysaccharide export system protein LptA
MILRHVKPLLLVGLTLVPAAPLSALSSDRNKPVTITADRMQADEHKGTSHYQGDVFLKQGSLEIHSDELVVHVKNGEVQKIIVTGSPATLQQQPDDREMVYSEARRMEYDTRSGQLLLIDDAHVKQGSNRFSGARIDYDTRNSIVAANRDNTDSRESPDDDGRVRAIIEPADDPQEPSP